VCAASSLEGRVGLVTGAGRNIGRQICLTLAERGCDVAVVVRSNLEEAQAVVEAVAQRGRRAVAIAADVGDASAVRRMAETASRAFGRIDVLVNNAVLRDHVGFTELTDDAWARVWAVNVSGPLLACRAVVPLMIERGGGSIVNVTGIAQYTGGAAHMATVKAALHGLTRGLAHEFGPQGVRANCIVPSATETTRPAARDPVHDEALLLRTPLRRLGTVADVASAVAFLASDESAYITGQSLHVNGGQYMV